MHDYDGWEYGARAIHDWDVLGEIHYFNVISKTPSQAKIDYYDISGFGVSEILNWMCAEGVIDSGEYLVEVVQYI